MKKPERGHVRASGVAPCQRCHPLCENRLSKWDSNRFHPFAQGVQMFPFHGIIWKPIFFARKEKIDMSQNKKIWENRFVEVNRWKSSERVFVICTFCILGGAK